jgi:acetyl esterase
MAARASPGLVEMLLGKGPGLFRVEDVDIRNGDHMVGVRLYHPGATITGVALFLHGGGWVRGSIDSYDAYARILAKRSGVTIASIDYRLAPEHSFPAGLEDCMAVLRWAAGEFSPEGTPRTLTLVGESAGGNLAAAAAMLASRQGIKISGQVLIYPVTDYALDTASYRRFGERALLTRAAMANFWDLYAAGHDRRDFRLSPLRAGDLRGTAPAFILTAGRDVLRDEGEAYGAKLEAAGVPTLVRRYESLPHGFIALERLSHAARQANDDVTAFLASVHTRA